jgi:jasmonate O-methyltransferase
MQSALQTRMKPQIEAAITKLLCSTTNTVFPQKMVIADFGCSSGPNALASVSAAVDAIDDHCVKFNQTPPEICVLLNDLPDNDFNTVLKSLVTLSQSSKPALVTVGIIPGSFYKRLFTSCSSHLFCTSNSLNWLSQVCV